MTSDEEETAGESSGNELSEVWTRRMALKALGIGAGLSASSIRAGASPIAELNIDDGLGVQGTDVFYFISGDRIKRYDRSADSVTDLFAVPSRAREGSRNALAYGDSSLWFADATEDNFDGRIAELDPTTGEQRSEINLRVDITGLAFGDGSLWAADITGNNIIEFTPDGQRVNEFDVRGPADTIGPQGLAYSSDSVFLGENDNNSVHEFAPDGTHRGEILSGDSYESLAATDAELLGTNADGDLIQLLRLEAQETGFVSGRVSDQDNNGLSGIEVTIITNDGEVAATTTTVEDGDYIVEVAPGEYRATAKIGDDTGQEGPFRVESNRTTTVNIVVDIEQEVSTAVTRIETQDFPRIETFDFVRKDDAPVNGLDADSFEIFENDVLQDIENVEAVGESDTTIGTVLIIDSSDSMNDRLDDAKAAAKEFLSNFRTDDQAAIIGYDSEVDLVQEFTDDRALLDDAIESLKEGGQTALFDAAIEGVRQTDSTVDRSSVIILADGENNEDPDDGDETVDDAIDAANDAGVPIYTIGLETDAYDEENLRRLAEETGGLFLQAPSASELEQIYTDISENINSEYLVEYTTTNDARDGTERIVETTVTVNGDRATDTSKYVAPSSPSVSKKFQEDRQAKLGSRTGDLAPVADRVDDASIVSTLDPFRGDVGDRLLAEDTVAALEDAYQRGDISAATAEDAMRRLLIGERGTRQVLDTIGPTGSFGLNFSRRIARTMLSVIINTALIYKTAAAAGLKAALIGDSASDILSGDAVGYLIGSFIPNGEAKSLTEDRVRTEVSDIINKIESGDVTAVAEVQDLIQAAVDDALDPTVARIRAAFEFSVFPFTLDPISSGEELQSVVAGSSIWSAIVTLQMGLRPSQFGSTLPGSTDVADAAVGQGRDTIRKGLQGIAEVYDEAAEDLGELSIADAALDVFGSDEPTEALPINVFQAIVSVVGEIASIIVNIIEVGADALSILITRQIHGEMVTSVVNGSDVVGEFATPDISPPNGGGS